MILRLLIFCFFNSVLFAETIFTKQLKDMSEKFGPTKRCNYGCAKDETGLAVSCKEIIKPELLCEKTSKPKQLFDTDYDRRAHESMIDWIMREIPGSKPNTPPMDFISMALQANKISEFSKERNQRRNRLLKELEGEVVQVWGAIKKSTQRSLYKHLLISPMYREKITRLIESTSLILDNSQISKVVPSDREQLSRSFKLICSLNGDSDNAFFTQSMTSGAAYIILCPGMLKKIDGGTGRDTTERISFVLAHEIGHLISSMAKGAFDQIAFCFKNLPMSAQLKERPNRKWYEYSLEGKFGDHREEYIADLWGYEILADHLSSRQLSKEQLTSYLKGTLEVICRSDGADGVHPDAFIRLSIAHSSVAMTNLLSCLPAKEHSCHFY